MLARLSMLFNIVLGWAVYKIHTNEDLLRAEVIECHRLRHEDFRRIVEDQGYIKKTQEHIANRVEENADKITKVEEKAEQIAKDKVIEDKQKNQSTE